MENQDVALKPRAHFLRDFPTQEESFCFSFRDLGNHRKDLRPLLLAEQPRRGQP